MILNEEGYTEEVRFPELFVAWTLDDDRMDDHQRHPWVHRGIFKPVL